MLQQEILSKSIVRQNIRSCQKFGMFFKTFKNLCNWLDTNNQYKNYIGNTPNLDIINPKKISPPFTPSDQIAPFKYRGLCDTNTEKPYERTSNVPSSNKILTISVTPSDRYKYIDFYAKIISEFSTYTQKQGSEIQPILNEENSDSNVFCNISNSSSSKKLETDEALRVQNAREWISIYRCIGNIHNKPQHLIFCPHTPQNMGTNFFNDFILKKGIFLRGPLKYNLQNFEMLENYYDYGKYEFVKVELVDPEESEEN